MAWQWVKESPAYWDEPKQAIVGGAQPGTFDLPAMSIGSVLPDEWWRVEENGEILGYGRMDILWGDAEVLLAVRSGQRGRGVGTFILDHLEREAAARGVNYLYNVVLPTHPRAYEVTQWLEQRRFKQSEDGLMRRSIQHG